MDRFIGPIRPSQHVPKLPQGKKADDQSQNFSLAEGEGEEPSPEEESKEETPDLPVGEARYDESGKRIDYTV